MHLRSQYDLHLVRTLLITLSDPPSSPPLPYSVRLNNNPDLRATRPDNKRGLDEVGRGLAVRRSEGEMKQSNFASSRAPPSASSSVLLVCGLPYGKSRNFLITRILLLPSRVTWWRMLIYHPLPSFLTSVAYENHTQERCLKILRVGRCLPQSANS